MSTDVSIFEIRFGSLIGQARQWWYDNMSIDGAFDRAFSTTRPQPPPVGSGGTQEQWDEWRQSISDSVAST